MENSGLGQVVGTSKKLHGDCGALIGWNCISEAAYDSKIVSWNMLILFQCGKWLNCDNLYFGGFALVS